MEEWKEYKLGDISSMKYGKLPPKHNCGNYPIWSGYRYVGMSNTMNCPKDTVIVVARGVGGTGDVKIAKEDCFLTNLSISVDIDKNICNPYYFKYKYYLSNLKYLDSGSAQSQITIDDLKRLIIKLPPLNHQTVVVSILKSLDDKIELNRRINDNLFLKLLLEALLIWWVSTLINDNLEQQAQALFKSWFVDFEPFKDGEFVESQLGMIPKGWRVKELGEVTTPINEKVKSRKDIKVLSPVTTGELVLSEDYFTKQVFSDSIAKYIVVKPNDFAYNPARINIGSLGINDYNFDGCVSPVYVVFRCEEEYQFFFDLFRRTQFFKEEVKVRAIGGVRQTLGYKDFSLIKVVYPPMEIVKIFNCIYSTLLKEKKRNNLENILLSEVRNDILPKLMSGELKVNEIENLV
jgi:type I restriction enzyme S subunit